MAYHNRHIREFKPILPYHPMRRRVLWDCAEEQFAKYQHTGSIGWWGEIQKLICFCRRKQVEIIEDV